mgnify:CR=1 FL=1
MTKSEAVIHLSLAADDDLDDCIEMALFKAKQELIQKVDNVFIFPAKEKRLSLLQEAANTLGHSFPEEVRLQRVPISTETIRTRRIEKLTTATRNIVGNGRDCN